MRRWILSSSAPTARTAVCGGYFGRALSSAEPGKKVRRRPTFESAPEVKAAFPYALMYGEIPAEEIVEELYEDGWVSREDQTADAADADAKNTAAATHPLLELDMYSKDDTTDAGSLRLLADADASNSEDWDENDAEAAAAAASAAAAAAAADVEGGGEEDTELDPFAVGERGLATASMSANMERMSMFDVAELEAALEADESQTERQLYRAMIDAVSDVAAVRKRRQAFFRRIAERAKTPERREARSARRAETRDFMRKHDYVGVSNLVPTLTPENTPLLTEELRAQLQPQLEMYARGIGLNPSWSMPHKQRFMRMLVKFFNEDPNGQYAQDVQDGMFFMPIAQMREVTPAQVREILERRRQRSAK